MPSYPGLYPPGMLPPPPGAPGLLTPPPGAPGDPYAPFSLAGYPGGSPYPPQPPAPQHKTNNSSLAESLKVGFGDKSPVSSRLQVRTLYFRIRFGAMKFQVEICVALVHF